MQTPERLALIGGSILLSSLLIFSLRGQASQIIPQVGHSISKVYDHIGDTQKSVDFGGNFQQAQNDKRTTGTWGSSKYYIDKDDNLHIGQGELSGPLYDTLGEDQYRQLRTVNFDQPVQAPTDSSALLAGGDSGNTPTNLSDRLTAINGIDRLNTSNVTNMFMMFGKNPALKELDLSSLKTDKAQDMEGMFIDDNNLVDLNMRGWDTQHVQDMARMFTGNDSLKDLDLSNFDTSNVQNMYGILSGTSGISHLILSDKAVITGYTGIEMYSHWQQGSTNLDYTQITNGQLHPGTWSHK